jgi:hypothetical protein
VSLAAVPADGLRAVTGGLEDLDTRYSADVWHATELGVLAARGRGRASFAGISQPWFKEAAKAWARQRLTLDGAFNTVQVGSMAFRRFSGFIASCQPPVEHPDEIDRPLLEAYLAWLASQPLADATKALSRVFLRSFLDENRRYSWVGAIPSRAVIYHDEVGSRRRSSAPRFIPEFVMAQLESE